MAIASGKSPAPNEASFTESDDRPHFEDHAGCLGSSAASPQAPSACSPIGKLTPVGALRRRAERTQSIPMGNSRNEQS
jgi:hypothetical protein